MQPDILDTVVGIGRNQELIDLFLQNGCPISSLRENGLQLLFFFNPNYNPDFIQQVLEHYLNYYKYIDIELLA